MTLDVDSVQDRATAQATAPTFHSWEHTQVLQASSTTPLTHLTVAQVADDLRERMDNIDRNTDPSDSRAKRQANVDVKEASDAVSRWMRFWIEETPEFKGRHFTPHASRSRLYAVRKEHLAFTSYHEISPRFVVALKFELVNGDFTVIATLRHINDGNGFASLNWSALAENIDVMRFHPSTPMDAIASHARYQALCLHTQLLVNAGIPHNQALSIVVETWPLDKE